MNQEQFLQTHYGQEVHRIFQQQVFPIEKNKVLVLRTYIDALKVIIKHTDDDTITSRADNTIKQLREEIRKSPL